MTGLDGDKDAPEPRATNKAGRPEGRRHKTYCTFSVTAVLCLRLPEAPVTVSV